MRDIYVKIPHNLADGACMDWHYILLQLTTLMFAIGQKLIKR